MKSPRNIKTIFSSNNVIQSQTKLGYSNSNSNLKSNNINSNNKNNHNE